MADFLVLIIYVLINNAIGEKSFDFYLETLYTVLRYHFQHNKMTEFEKQVIGHLKSMSFMIFLILIILFIS